MSVRGILSKEGWLESRTRVGAVKLSELQCPNGHDEVITWEEPFGVTKLSCEDCEEEYEFSQRDVMDV